jgi:hypothetical protein
LFTLLAFISTGSMHYETVRFHLTCAKGVSKDQSVSPITGRLRNRDNQRGFMAHLEKTDVPVARLIGFEAKEIADGRALGR